MSAIGRPTTSAFRRSAIQLLVALVGADAEPVERLREEAARRRREDDVHDLGLREPEVTEPLQVVVADRRRIIDDPLGQRHDREVDFVEAGRVAIADDREHRLAEALVQDRAVRETAVARPEPLRGGERHQLVAAEVHPILDCAVQLAPRPRRPPGAP